MDASDINFVSDYLAGLAKANNLPPKILVVHRLRRTWLPTTRILKFNPKFRSLSIWMAGASLRLNMTATSAYTFGKSCVQFAGYKLFYKNDIRKQGSHMLSPEEVLAEKPQPIYIQYQ